MYVMDIRNFFGFVFNFFSFFDPVPDNETKSNSHNTLIHCATNLMGVVSKILFIADTVKLRASCQNMQGESRCQSNC